VEGEVRVGIRVGRAEKGVKNGDGEAL